MQMRWMCAARSRLLSTCAAAALALAAIPVHAAPFPWSDPSLSPDVRADMVLQRMTLDEKIGMMNGQGGYQPGGRIVGSAGFTPGVPRLGVPDLQESDASIGVAQVGDVRGPGLPSQATPLPSSIATAATWNPARAYAGGAMIATEALDTGLNMLLNGGVNLTRDSRGGRTFEYLGEDPLLAGTMMGWAVRGIQDQHVISTTKHYALNDQEDGRNIYHAIIGERAARESDLLAFEIGIEIGQPGAVMCSYNRYNNVYACENDYLLNQTLKHDWGYTGWVLSDWGGVHSTADSLNAGLDQESGGADYRDFYGPDLAFDLRHGDVSIDRVNQAVHRMLRTIFAVGLFDHPAVKQPKDAVNDALVSQASEEEGAVLLRNAGHLLPLSHDIRSIAVIGNHSDVGVLSGGGSGQVEPIGGNAVPGDSFVWDPSSPLKAIKQIATRAHVIYDPANYSPADDYDTAARTAAQADVAVVFVQSWESEGFDVPMLGLYINQDDLVRKVAAANPNTIVVVESGGPVLMPWANNVGAILESWYPGAAGGTAIARILFGDVNPSGHLPLTFPQSASQLPRPVIPGSSIAPGKQFAVDFNIEGPNVGYKWFDLTGRTPLFPFGFGLSYTDFAYRNLRVTGSAKNLTAAFDVANIGDRQGKAVPQLYLGFPAGSGEAPVRLIGFQKVDLLPGQTQHVQVRIDPRLLATFSEAGHAWQITAGQYPLYLGDSSRHFATATNVTLSGATLKP